MKEIFVGATLVVALHRLATVPREGAHQGPPLGRPASKPDPASARATTEVAAANLHDDQAAAALLSPRKSRRRIFPTLVLGSAVLNSICLGTL